MPTNYDAYLSELKDFYKQRELEELEKERLEKENEELKEEIKRCEKANVILDKEYIELQDRIQILTDKMKKTIKFNKQFVEIEGCSNYVIKMLEEYLKILGVENNESKNNK